MKLFLLVRKDTDWDEFSKHLVRARNEREARIIANTCCGDEGTIWDSAGLVHCRVITSKGKPEIVMSDFNPERMTLAMFEKRKVSV